jgi:hypothetical protein
MDQILLKMMASCGSEDVQSCTARWLEVPAGELRKGMGTEKGRDPGATGCENGRFRSKNFDVISFNDNGLKGCVKHA